jgi:hypothetical protein
MNIRGVENMPVEELNDHVARGGRFVVFTYTVSVLVMTFKRSTDIYFIKPGQSAAMKGMPWTVMSFFLGWWGFPWGFIYTPASIFGNLSGGKDVTREVMAALGGPQAAPVAQLVR